MVEENGRRKISCRFLCWLKKLSFFYRLNKSGLMGEIDVGGSMEMGRVMY
jgi:hypothetical protein